MQHILNPRMESQGTHQLHTATLSAAAARNNWKNTSSLVAKQKRQILPEVKLSLSLPRLLWEQLMIIIKDLACSELLVWHKALLHVLVVKFMARAKIVFFFLSLALPLARWKLNEKFRCIASRTKNYFPIECEWWIVTRPGGKCIKSLKYFFELVLCDALDSIKSDKLISAWRFLRYACEKGERKAEIHKQRFEGKGRMNALRFRIERNE